MVDIPKIIAVVKDLSVILGVGFGAVIYAGLLKAKKAEAELLKARVEHLERLSAPALAVEMQKMAPLLDEYIKKNQELEQQARDFPPATTRTPLKWSKFFKERAVFERSSSCSAITCLWAIYFLQPGFRDDFRDDFRFADKPNGTRNSDSRLPQ